MAFDFRKEYKEYYLPKNKPEIITVPRANYIAVKGRVIPMKKMGHINKHSVCCMRLRIR